MPPKQPSVSAVPPLMSPPPKLVMPAGELFVVGSPLVKLKAGDETEYEYGDFRAKIRLTWSASDDSGLPLTYSVAGIWWDGTRKELAAGLTRPSYTGSFDTVTYGPKWWLVTAYDAAGNATTGRLWGGAFGVASPGDWGCFCEDLALYQHGRWFFEIMDPALKYGYWATAEPGAYQGVRVIRPGPLTKTVAVVMNTGPQLGKVRITVQGTVVATVDTYSPTPRKGVIVWSGLLTAQKSYVRIINEGTDGRQRIEMAAFITY